VDEEQFARLDQIASALRTGKSRLQGGGWRLQDFYSIVDSIGDDDAAALARIALLHRWMEARPGSITPALLWVACYTVGRGARAAVARPTRSPTTAGGCSMNVSPRLRRILPKRRSFLRPAHICISSG